MVARSLGKSYGERVAVDGIDFEVEPATCFGFLGPNGAGKTSTMKMIYGLATVGRGELSVLGLDARTKRRLLVARALINEPEMVVLDEPTTGLDPQARLAVWRSLETLKRRGVTLLLTTHYMEEAARLCDRQGGGGSCIRQRRPVYGKVLAGCAAYRDSGAGG